MRNRKRYFLIGAVVIVAAVLIAVEYRAIQAKPLKIIYVSKSADESDFWSMLIEGASMAADEKDAELEVVAPEKENDIARQNELIAEAIQKKPDAIVLAPADYVKTLSAARKIKSHGIKLVLIDSVLEKDIADAVITTDNVAAGEIMGLYASKLCEEQDGIGIVSHVKGASTAIDRESGFRKGLKDKSGNVVETVFSDSSYSHGYEVTKEMLLAHPEITLVAGLNEYSTVGAGRAIKDMGLSGKVKIVGFDNSIEEIQMLESGLVNSIVIQKPFDMGYLGVKTAIALANHETPKATVDSGSKLIVRENIYTKENQKLLFPFHEKNKY